MALGVSAVDLTSGRQRQLSSTPSQAPRGDGEPIEFVLLKLPLEFPNRIADPILVIFSSLGVFSISSLFHIAKNKKMEENKIAKTKQNEKQMAPFVLS
ncbi:hypothetical protein CEXT_249441 [Caerostris extrusa]|uniref:Uncharacterized protein n=1 Tax=Caerostris extrusa TaxID=172846 RepID=A0AAV4QJ41_CAEEX|nr:hypothetical protein CEXT_249441 [Caerostris extrusa]